MTGARCVPRRGRSRPRPARPIPLLAAPTGGFFFSCRPPWTPTPGPGTGPRGCPGSYWPSSRPGAGWSAWSTCCTLTAPSGILTNPRGFAAHYTGWTLDLPARLADHAAGRGARLMEVVTEAGIGWQLARVWPGTRTRERSLKGSGGAARRCPVCQLTRLGLAPARPADLFAFEVGARAAALVAPPSELLAGGGRMTPVPTHPQGGEPMPASPAWLRTSQAAARLHVTATTVTRWASEGRLTHRRTLGGHRRFDPELIDALVEALTYRP